MDFVLRHAGYKQIDKSFAFLAIISCVHCDVGASILDVAGSDTTAEEHRRSPDHRST
jgi:hypothetical protein